MIKNMVIVVLCSFLTEFYLIDATDQLKDEIETESIEHCAQIANWYRTPGTFRIHLRPGSRIDINCFTLDKELLSIDHYCALVYGIEHYIEESLENMVFMFWMPSGVLRVTLHPTTNTLNFRYFDERTATFHPPIEVPIPSSFGPKKAFTFSIYNVTETHLWFSYDGLLYAIDLQESTNSVNEIGVNHAILMGIFAQINQQRIVFTRRTDMKMSYKNSYDIFDNELPPNLATINLNEGVLNYCAKVGFPFRTGGTIIYRGSPLESQKEFSFIGCMP